VVSVNSIEYGTLAIKVALFFKFTVVFSSTYFLFRQVQTNYWVISMSMGKEHQTRSSYLLSANNNGAPCTDKKEKQIFLIYKEIQSGAVAKSYMRKGFLIYEEMRKYFPIYEEAVSHI